MSAKDVELVSGSRAFATPAWLSTTGRSPRRRWCLPPLTASPPLPPPLSPPLTPLETVRLPPCWSGVCVALASAVSINTESNVGANSGCISAGSELQLEEKLEVRESVRGKQIKNAWKKWTEKLLSCLAASNKIQPNLINCSQISFIRYSVGSYNNLDSGYALIQLPTWNSKTRWDYGSPG